LLYLSCRFNVSQTAEYFVVRYYAQIDFLVICVYSSILDTTGE